MTFKMNFLAFQIALLFLVSCTEIMAFTGFLQNIGVRCTMSDLNGIGNKSPTVSKMYALNSLHQKPTALNSSPREYNDFGDFDDDDDDDDDDDYIDLDDSAVANFKAMMGIEEDSEESEIEEEEDFPEIIEDSGNSFSSVDELISFATSSKSAEEPSMEWAKPVDISDLGKALESGICLVANPAKFCDDFGGNKPPSLALLSKFGLTLPPPPELGPDRRADLLPVLLLLDRHPLKGSHAILLNRRTGYLIGDLENQQLDKEDGTNSSPPPNLGAFMIQPLWFGGTYSGNDQSDSVNGLDMIHFCPAVKGSRKITDDGLYHGGDPSQAQEAMNDPSLERPMTGFDFKFFVQSTKWLPLQVSYFLYASNNKSCSSRLTQYDLDYSILFYSPFIFNLFSNL